MNMFRWTDILERIGDTGLGSQSVTGEEGMTASHLVGVLKHARFWSSRGVLERSEGRWGRGRSKRKGEW